MTIVDSSLPAKLKKGNGLMRKLGATIHMLRTQKNLSQEELAEAVGVSVLAVQSYESNKWQPGDSVLNKLAECFEMTVRELVSGYSLLYEEGTDEVLIVRQMADKQVKIMGVIRDEKVISWSEQEIRKIVKNL